MYNATPAAAAAWRALFARVHADLALEVEVIEHRWPQPIETLWDDARLCGAFMCGWPFTRAPGMQAIAAPVPSPPRYEGLARYCSNFLAREASGWHRLEDSFGHRFGWMAANSQSGFNAPRAHLARFTSASRPALFSESIGPLGNPAKALEALREGKVDLVALDSFYLDLLRHYEPARLEGLRAIATTEWSPIPLLVAAPSIEGEIVDRMREHLIHMHRDASCRVLLEAVLLDRFVAPDPAAYELLERKAQEAIASGYADIR
jgi:ABC-type phosphate/phosphonate transport system substrate-binding protein